MYQLVAVRQYFFRRKYTTCFVVIQIKDIYLTLFKVILILSELRQKPSCLFCASYLIIT